MACDGVYDVFSNEELTMLLRAQVAEKENITAAVEGWVQKLSRMSDFEYHAEPWKKF